MPEKPTAFPPLHIVDALRIRRYSDPVFYLVESVPEPEPELDLDDLAGKVMFGICAMFAGCVASALLAGM